MHFIFIVKLVLSGISVFVRFYRILTARGRSPPLRSRYFPRCPPVALKHMPRQWKMSENNNQISYAYDTMDPSILSSQIRFMYNKNKIGPNTLRCGTPKSIVHS
jgi:hypothetical protein